MIIVGLTHFLYMWQRPLRSPTWYFWAWWWASKGVYGYMLGQHWDRKRTLSGFQLSNPQSESKVISQSIWCREEGRNHRKSSQVIWQKHSQVPCGSLASWSWCGLQGSCLLCDSSTTHSFVQNWQDDANWEQNCFSSMPAVLCWSSYHAIHTPKTF